jgi:hypothetical protein
MNYLNLISTINEMKLVYCWNEINEMNLIKIINELSIMNELN